MALEPTVSGKNKSDIMCGECLRDHDATVHFEDEIPSEKDVFYCQLCIF